LPTVKPTHACQFVLVEGYVNLRAIFYEIGGDAQVI